MNYSIDPVFEEVRRGKRIRRIMVGVQLTIDGAVVGLFANYIDAEAARNDIMRDLLTSGQV